MPHSAIQMRPTSTPLDLSIGGLGCGELHVLLGPSRSWNVTMLAVMAYGSRSTWRRILWSGLDLPEGLRTAPNIGELQCPSDNVDDLCLALMNARLGNEDLVVIEDMSDFRHKRGSPHTARGWGMAVDFVRLTGATLLVAGRRAPGQVILFKAHMQLHLEEIAQARAFPCSVLQLVLNKHRTRPTGESRFFWMSRGDTTLQEA